MQQNYFFKYLSLAPVLLFAHLIFVAVVWIIFNTFFPDLLFHPLP
uniref:Photosystem I reaction center subunit IX n=1 Tax=Calothrix membranacea SAG 1410-1 TaxID=1521523 RepID=A0A2L2FQM5_9CYAN|nr:photosystem I reaction center subunit IX [Calothrix membranacea SAG 1410-1]